MLSWRQVERFARENGYEFHHQRGSHRIYVHGDGREISIPRHREIKRGTLQALLRAMGATREQLLEWLG